MEPASSAESHVNGAAPGGVQRIDHVAVAVLDADAAASWYVDNLRMRISADEFVEAAGVRLVYLVSGLVGATDQTAVQLVQPVTPGSIASFIQERGEGLHHVCFTVDAIPDMLVALGEDGGGLFLGGRGRRACFLQTRPHDVLIELTETALSGQPVPWSDHKRSSPTIGRPVDQSRVGS